MTISLLQPLSRSAGLLLALLPLLTVHAAEPVVLRVLCYNIHYGQGNDGEYNVERLAEVIRQTRPDLVALQEVDVGVERSGRVHQAQQLGERTGMAVSFGPTQHFQGGLFGNAVMTRMPIQSVIIHPLPYTESTAERTTYPRGAIAVTVQLPDGRPLQFISTHFQHNVPEDRVQEAHAINRLFAADQATSSDTTAGTTPLFSILAGDINATPSDEPVQILQQHWTNALDAQAAPTVPSQQPTSRIDYVFFRGPGVKLVQSQVIAEAMASDHRPVLAVIEIPPK